MRSILPTTHKDFAALLGEKLKLNPLVLSLFAISPADALDHLGIKNIGGWLDLRRAASVEDRAQVARVLEALRAGRTELDTTQQITTADAGDPRLTELVLSPYRPAPPVSRTLTCDLALPPARPAPDITISVARTTLQYALRLYAQHQFIGHSFHLAPQPWLDVEARGAAIAIELAEGSARIIASFDSTFTGSAQLAGRRVTLFTKRSPIEIDLSALISINRAGQLCVGVGPGTVRVPRLPLPAAFIETLYQRVRETLSAVPMVYLPTRVAVPEASAVISDEMQVDLSHIIITEHAVTVELQLFFGPTANPI